MIVTTKRGDKGLTSLYGAKRIPKHHPLIEVNGAIDAVQALIGVVKAFVKSPKLKASLENNQLILYQIMAHVASAKEISPTEFTKLTEKVETQQAQLLKETPLSNRFVVPGVNQSEAFCHLARVEIRAAERLLSRHARKYPRLHAAIPYFNRLSDYFFVLSQSLLK